MYTFHAIFISPMRNRPSFQLQKPWCPSSSGLLFFLKERERDRVERGQWTKLAVDGDVVGTRQLTLRQEREAPWQRVESSAGAAHWDYPPSFISGHLSLYQSLCFFLPRCSSSSSSSISITASQTLRALDRPLPPRSPLLCVYCLLNMIQVTGGEEERGELSPSLTATIFFELFPEGARASERHH